MGDFISYWDNEVCNTVPGVIFTTFHGFFNSWMGPVSKSVCSWQGIPALFNVTLYLIGFIHKLLRKWSVVNMFHESYLFTIVRVLFNSWMGPISKSVCPWQGIPALYIAKLLTLSYWVIWYVTTKMKFLIKSFWLMIWEPLEKLLDVKIALDMDIWCFTDIWVQRHSAEKHSPLSQSKRLRETKYTQ